MAISIVNRQAVNFNAPDAVTGLPKRDQYLDFVDESGVVVATLTVPASGGAPTFAVDEISFVPVKTYRAVLNQLGTADPVATVIENTLGVDIAWIRGDVGQYSGVSSVSGVFVIGATFVSQSLWDLENFTVVNPHQADADHFQISTYDFSGGITSPVGTDGLMSDFPLEIRVYQ